MTGPGAVRVSYCAMGSINVPSDKTRAVVDAMGWYKATTIATKAYLQLPKVH